MVKWDPMIFSVVLTKWAMEVMALMQGGSSTSQGPLVGSNILWVDGGPCVFWMSTLRAFPFHIKKGEKNLDN